MQAQASLAVGRAHHAERYEAFAALFQEVARHRAGQLLFQGGQCDYGRSRVFRGRGEAGHGASGVVDDVVQVAGPAAGRAG